MELILIRHTAVDVPRGTCYGQADVPLRPSFSVEAASVRARLFFCEPIDKVYTSPLSRCTLLAEQCGYADAIRDSRLLELDFGVWEMQRYEDIRDPRLESWYRDYLHVQATGGESFVQQLARVSSFLDEVRTKSYHRVVAFTHGGVIACAQIYAGNICLEDAFSHIPDYGEILSIHL